MGAAGRPKTGTTTIEPAFRVGSRTYSVFALPRSWYGRILIVRRRGTGKADDECRDPSRGAPKPAGADRPRPRYGPRDPRTSRRDRAQPYDLTAYHRPDPRCRVAADVPPEGVWWFRM